MCGPAHGEEKLVRVDEPILRVPQLAIHLSEDRKGVHLDPQRHLNGVWGVGTERRSFIDFVAERAEVPADAVLGWELMTHDLAPSALVGTEQDLVSAPRLDNQGTCYAGTRRCCRRPNVPGIRCRCSLCSTTRRWGACPIGARSPIS